MTHILSTIQRVVKKKNNRTKATDTVQSTFGKTKRKIPLSNSFSIPCYSTVTMAERPTIAMLPPEESGNEIFSEQAASSSIENSDNHHSVATLSSPWQFDDCEPACSSCKAEFNPFNRRHHCRLCGKIFCNDCSNQRYVLLLVTICLFLF